MNNPMMRLCFAKVKNKLDILLNLSRILKAEINFITIVLNAAIGIAIIKSKDINEERIPYSTPVRLRTKTSWYIRLERLAKLAAKNIKIAFLVNLSFKFIAI